MNLVYYKPNMTVGPEILLSYRPILVPLCFTLFRALIKTHRGVVVFHSVRTELT